MAALKFPHELDNLTLAQVADGLDKGVFSVANLTAAHLEQIRKWNPILHAVIDVNPNAMRDAAELDRELAAGQRR